MGKKYYNFIFVILVYRNYKDLEECLQSIAKKVKNYKCIVVNAFFDNETENSVKNIAYKYDCNFISIENKGYSYGNNTGMEYAEENYNFNYICISNPDIVVQNMPDDLAYIDADIIAPKIIAASGKNQNPMMYYNNHFSEFCMYYGFKHDLSVLFYFGIIFNRILREISIFLNKFAERKIYQIYAAHGCFVLLSKKVIKVLGSRLYDENMFLFAEEGLLAKKASEAGLSIKYCSDIYVYHKEDGSMKLADFSINNELRKSNIYFYEKYILNK